MEAKKIEQIENEKVELKLIENKVKNPYIINKWYDYSLFVFSPLIALAIGQIGAIITLGIDKRYPELNIVHKNPLIYLGTLFTLGHLFLVFFRSHLNKKIFKEFPIRFALVPPICFLSMTLSPYILAGMSILITWWDVYHSGLQTFGIGRIYDSKVGNDPNAGRRMDYFLNLFIYAGPILGGFTFFDHLKTDIRSWRVLSSALFEKIPVVEQSTGKLAIIFSLLTAVFMVGYIYHYKQLKKQGYTYPKLKLALFVSTAVTSIISWGFNPFGIAFFVMNFFHAIQYFAIVYFFEKKNLSEVFRLDKFKWRSAAIFTILAGVGLAYGAVAASQNRVDSEIYFIAFFHTVSLMHFWYDGFIWSVRKKHV